MEKWEAPKVIKLDSLPEALGACTSGTTVTTGNCEAGSTATTGNHCKTGGTHYQGNCRAGSSR